MAFNITNILSTKNPQKTLPKKLNTYPTVHMDDQFPVNIIDPDLEEGPWIAGGACLAWYQGNSVNAGDIDVFCKNEQQAKKLIRYISQELSLTDYNGYTSKIIETKNATTFHVEKNMYDVKGDQTKGGQWKIQIITCRYFDNIQAVIDNFDITVCQVATAGYQWVLGNKTAKDIHERNLRFNNFTPDAVKRLTKYWIYGYVPVDGTVEAITANTNSKWNFINDEEYNNAF